MPQTEPRHDASLFPVHFIQEHEQSSVCAHTHYAFLVKYGSCLATMDTTEKMKYIKPGRSWVDCLV